LKIERECRSLLSEEKYREILAKGGVESEKKAEEMIEEKQ